MGQDREDRQSRHAGLTGGRSPSPPSPSPSPSPGAPGDGPSGQPGFDGEIRAAIHYEKGLAVKALIALALVGVVVLLRLCWLG